MGEAAISTLSEIPSYSGGCSNGVRRRTPKRITEGKTKKKGKGFFFR
jgi:hypothetical protein